MGTQKLFDGDHARALAALLDAYYGPTCSDDLEDSSARVSFLLERDGKHRTLTTVPLWHLRALLELALAGAAVHDLEEL